MGERCRNLGALLGGFNTERGQRVIGQSGFAGAGSTSVWSCETLFGFNARVSLNQFESSSISCGLQASGASFHVHKSFALVVYRRA